MRNLRAAGVPIEINYSPTRFNVHEIDAAVDLAYELGAYSFYTGRTMYTGNAVKTWHHLEVTEEQYDAFFDALHAKTEEYRGRMRVYFHEDGTARGAALPRCSTRRPADRAAQRAGQAHQRPALRLRRLPHATALDEIWDQFPRAWHDPRVARFVEDLATDPGKTRTLHQWVYL